MIAVRSACPADVVQARVVRFAHERVDRANRLVARLRQGVGDDRLEGGPNGQSVGQDDRRLDRAQLLDLRRAGKLAEGVAHENGARDFLLKQVAAVGEDGRDARMDLLSIVDRRMPDPDSRDVGDGVEWSGREDAWCDSQARDRGRCSSPATANPRRDKQDHHSSMAETRETPVTSILAGLILERQQLGDDVERRRGRPAAGRWPAWPRAAQGRRAGGRSCRRGRGGYCSGSPLLLRAGGPSSSPPGRGSGSPPRRRVPRASASEVVRPPGLPTTRSAAAMYSSIAVV